MTKHATVFSKDLPQRQLHVERSFDASKELVWQAWTDAAILDQWWAPQPYRAETRRMDFRVGGYWLYCMVGPDGYRSWCRVNFDAIEVGNRIHYTNMFCDEAGNRNPDFPLMYWEQDFSEADGITTVKVTIRFDREADMEQIIGMGFQEGFTAGLSNLDHYIRTQFMLRGSMKDNNKARVCTYLNFSGNTAEAFHFYRDVLQGVFSGRGLVKFSDIPAPEGMPPLTDEQQDMIIHAELTIMGGHVLMGTDAPESMGFKLTPGNNMHINLEPESREETERIFQALSEGGVVTMPLADMFWGAYYGALTDKYGINWMLNFQEKTS